MSETEWRGEWTEVFERPSESVCAKHDYQCIRHGDAWPETETYPGQRCDFSAQWDFTSFRYRIRGRISIQTETEEEWTPEQDDAERYDRMCVRAADFERDLRISREALRVAIEQRDACVAVLRDVSIQFNSDADSDTLLIPDEQAKPTRLPGQFALARDLVRRSEPA